MWRSIAERRGQVTVETAILFGFVVAGLVAMSIYLQRGAQGGIKSNADSLGTQFSSTDTWTTHSRSSSEDTKGHTLSAQYNNACQGVGGVQNPGCLGSGVSAIWNVIRDPNATNPATRLNAGFPSVPDADRDQGIKAENRIKPQG